MWLGGKSARTISSETGTSICTVYRWIRRWREEGNVDSRPYRGKRRCYKVTSLPSGSEPSLTISRHLDLHYSFVPVYHFLKNPTWFKFSRQYRSSVVFAPGRERQCVFRYTEPLLKWHQHSGTNKNKWRKLWSW
ncbi:hypothetical protein O3P69_014351 [Scylla paramamosain]|uniref:Insertion element IS150 protein InsJ-like helix-turn-helix domain-containing protein n=1 Tax=Scylla paramamosain TaxID=85552 RepID=A0AAW0TAQ0_SCYPA